MTDLTHNKINKKEEREENVIEIIVRQRKKIQMV